MRLYHFSEDPFITTFKPRPVRVPSPRAPGREWLNGPLVWAIDASHQPMYLFPRDCPRILIWPEAQTTAADKDRWFGPGAFRMIAHVEKDWVERLRSATLYRYELPQAGFQSLNDAGMWVSQFETTPEGMEAITDLPAALAASGVDLRIMDSLVPLKEVWSTSLHASGLRLRNARGWPGA